MPIIAQSPPLIFGTDTPTPTPVPTFTSTPSPTLTQTPKPTKTPTPTPTPEIKIVDNEFVDVHRIFLEKLSSKECFKKEDLSEFTQQQINDHIEIALQDKFIVNTQDVYCTMDGIHKLTSKIKRTITEKEIIG